MKRLTMLLAASLTVTTAGAASAKDTRPEASAAAAPCTHVPITTDEARALAGARIAAGTAAASVPAKPAVHVDRMPSSTDEVRAIAAEPTRVVVAASSASRGDRIASSTDAARAIAAERTNDSVAASSLGHEEVCARCACNPGEQRARAAVDRCGCHHRT
jgi:hypothetical protein